MTSELDNSLPYVTENIPGLTGTIKKRPEDFLVEELPLINPSGRGSHLLVQIEKKGLATLDTIIRIARTLDIPLRTIGYAGLKDARAITRQWISLENVKPPQLHQLKIPGLKILETTRHTDRIKIGHLRGNCFIIRIRNLNTSTEKALTQANNIMAQLIDKGVPNYFGPQRFGTRRDAHLLGAAIIARRFTQFLDMFLGLPDPAEQSLSFMARSHYEKGNYKQAYDTWPENFYNQRRALLNLIKTGDKKHAYNTIRKQSKRFFIASFQSDLFNQVVAERMPNIDKLLTGDLAYQHPGGACFNVSDTQRQQPRCDNFEISPTGPLLGLRMPHPSGPAGDLENQILAQAALNAKDLQQMKFYKIKGARRPLRFKPQNVKLRTGHDNLGSYLQLKFELDPGCYATTLIREIIKNPTSNSK